MSEPTLEEIRAKRAVIAAKRAKRVEDSSNADAMATEVRGLAEDEAVEKAEIEHGLAGKGIEVLQTALGIVIVKRPHAAIYKRFRDAGKLDTRALEQFARPCVVYPDAAALDALLENQPATLERIANAAVVLAGVRTEELTGK